MRVNSTDVFHVDRRFWTSFQSRFPATGPRERAFHTATVIGNYMVVYGERQKSADTIHAWHPCVYSSLFLLLLPGGNVHNHYQEEKCYDEEIFFYHLGCHQWVSAGERWSLREFSQTLSYVTCLALGDTQACFHLWMVVTSLPASSVPTNCCLFQRWAFCAWALFTRCRCHGRTSAAGCWGLQRCCPWRPDGIQSSTVCQQRSKRQGAWKCPNVTTHEKINPCYWKDCEIYLSLIKTNRKKEAEVFWTRGTRANKIIVFVFPCQDAVCAEALDESMCLKNPECSWCEGRCREYQPTNPVTIKHLVSDWCIQMYSEMSTHIHFYLLLWVSVRMISAVSNACSALCVHSVAVLGAWAWHVSCLTASPALCSVALQLPWPVPLVNLAGVFRMSPAYQCQVRPREGGRRAEEQLHIERERERKKKDVGSWHGRD